MRLESCPVGYLRCWKTDWNVGTISKHSLFFVGARGEPGQSKHTLKCAASSATNKLHKTVLVRHTCIGKLLCCTAEATSLIVDLRYDVNALCRQE